MGGGGGRKESGQLMGVGKGEDRGRMKEGGWRKDEG